MFLDCVASIIDRYYLIFDENYKRLKTINILIISQLRVVKFQKMYIFMYNGVYTLDKGTFICKGSVCIAYKSDLYSRRVECIYPKKFTAYLQRACAYILKKWMFLRGGILHSKVHVQNKIIIAREKYIIVKSVDIYLQRYFKTIISHIALFHHSPFRFVFN